MNKRQRKKKGLLDQTIKIGSRVLVVKNTMNGHEVGTIGDVVGIRITGNMEVLAPYVFEGGFESVFSLTHQPSDLKKLQSRGRRYFL